MQRFLGFNLIEIMIALIVIGVLTAISIPVYTQHIARAKRVEAEILLTKLAAALEQYYTINHTYQNATLAKLGMPEIVADNHYQLIIESTNALNYSLAAKPIAEQASADKECGTLTLNALGGRGNTGFGSTISCW